MSFLLFLLENNLHCVRANNPSPSLYMDYTGQITQPIIRPPMVNETLSTGETDANQRPIVYFQAPSSATTAKPGFMNASLVIYEQPPASSHVEYVNESGHTTTEQAALLENHSPNEADRSNSEEMQVLLVNSKNDGQQQLQPQQHQWSPRLPEETPKRQLQYVTSKKSKKSKKRPVLLIAQSVPEEDDDVSPVHQERLPAPKASAMTKYVVLAQDGSRIPVIMQSSNTVPQEVQGSVEYVGNPTSDDSVGKDDRLYDYYSNKLASGPFGASTGEGAEGGTLEQPFVKYSAIPPPLPPPQMPGMPIMANIYWRKIIYNPVSMVPPSAAMVDPTVATAAASSSASSTVDQMTGVASKPRGQKYIVYYVRKDNGSESASNKGLRLISTNSDQQQALAQNIIRQIEQMEANSNEGAVRQQAPSPTSLVGTSSLVDQETDNSQLQLKVINGGKLPIGHVLAMGSSDRQRNKGKKPKSNNWKEQAMGNGPADEEVIVLRRRPPTSKIHNLQKIKQKTYRRVVTNPGMVPVRLVARNDAVQPVFRIRKHQSAPSYVKLVKI